MTRIRVFVFLLTITVMIVFGSLFALYARGYRFDPKTFKFMPNGILVIRSEPDAAQVFIDGQLKTATNATISLSPGIYNVTVKKEGYTTWDKQLTIEKEVVTEADTTLFRTAPSLSPVTFSGSAGPVISDDYTKIAYYEPFDPKTPEKNGLWLIETINLPIGFSRDPRRLTDGDFSNATYEFSPDGRQIVVTKKEAIYLLDTSTFTPQTKLVNINLIKKQDILTEWQDVKKNKLEAQLRNIPQEAADIIKQSTNIAFSPDETKILYTGNVSANLKDKLKPPLLGSSTQSQARAIKPGKTYVYDIKEDRNFLVLDQDQTLNQDLSVKWLGNSKNFLLTEKEKVSVIDYDGTNKQTVYSGAYIAPYAFPFVNTSKILILTNLGATSTISNLYSLTIK